MFKSPRILHPATVGIALLFITTTAVIAADPPGFNPKRHMHASEVRPGMKGYGLTVFHGVKIEPFPLEVVSVERGFAADKSVVWIRCTGPQMQLTGPVQGMSGSPIFLWDDGGEHKLGEGGRMIGAFAFGHRLGKDCYVGVQPIEQMLDAGSRLNQERAIKSANAEGHTGVRDTTLTSAWRMAQRAGLDETQTWRLKALSDLAGLTPPKPGVGNAAAELAPLGAGAQREHMALPVAVPTVAQAELLEPLFAPYGLQPTPMQVGSTSNLPPSWINKDAVKLEPGSVFAIPLVSGPIEMAAIGTTTEVLPDGTALAFGHQMFQQGDIDIPMATGFVHFVQPNISASFKLGASIKVVGSMLRDEQSAVIGKPGAPYPTVPCNIKVNWPDATQNREHHYVLTYHTGLLPQLIGGAASASLTADTALPLLNTLKVKSKVTFENGRTLEINNTIPGANPARALINLISPVATLIENEFGTLKVTAIDATIDVADDLEAAQVINVTLDQDTVFAGKTLVAHVRLKPYRGPEQLKRVELKIPDDVPDGQYQLMIGGSMVYRQLQQMLRPHKMNVANADELFDAVQEITDLKDDRLYAVLRLGPSNNLAIGRSELPRLPSSRVALLAVKTSTRTTTYSDSVEATLDVPYVVLNQASLSVSVVNPETASQTAPPPQP
ncbi:MAG: hypothetical protein GC159_09340 [Phycisphaera sp.]|nr:hypothetical protein [Phycisphaera sp.]